MEENKNIDQLMELLPPGYEEACYVTKAIERNRIIKSARDLMVLCIIYLSQACSLLEISKYSNLLGLGKISDVGFMKKFSKCGNWFKWIIGKLTSNSTAIYKKPSVFEKYKVILLDASDVTTSGAAKQIWRLHYAIDIYEMKSEQYLITTEKTGESLTNYKIKPDYLVVGDRIYGTKTGIEYCLNGHGNFIFRVRSKAFNFYSDEGKVINLLSEIEKLECTKATAIDVKMKASNKEYITLRICVIKKAAEEAEKSRRRINRRDSKNGQRTSDETKKMNDYIVLITSLPKNISAEEILSLYRVRWQVELYFKRLKSLLSFGDIPKKKEESVEVWLNGKLMIALLIENLIAKAVSFSP